MTGITQIAARMKKTIEKRKFVGFEIRFAADPIFVRRGRVGSIACFLSISDTTPTSLYSPIYPSTAFQKSELSGSTRLTIAFAVKIVTKPKID